MSDYINQEKAKLEKYFKELTPERQKDLKAAFDENKEPEMRMMQFGGYHLFDPNNKQVELDGTFSRADLMRIILSMK